MWVILKKKKLRINLTRMTPIHGVDVLHLTDAKITTECHLVCDRNYYQVVLMTFLPYLQNPVT